MRTIGTLTKWNDDRGFGFITPNQSGEDVFVHISAFPRDGKRPAIGEIISFETKQDEEKTKAENIQRPQQKRNNAGQHPRSGHVQKDDNKLITNLVTLTIFGIIAYFGYDRFKQRFIPDTASQQIIEQKLDNPNNKAALIETQSQYDSVSISQTSDNAIIPEQRSASAFQCDGRTYCSSMHSYEEAKYFLDNCPNTKMDGDHDGVPCEDQFNK